MEFLRKANQRQAALLRKNREDLAAAIGADARHGWPSLFARVVSIVKQNEELSLALQKAADETKRAMQSGNHAYDRGRADGLAEAQVKIDALEARLTGKRTSYVAAMGRALDGKSQVPDQLSEREIGRLQGFREAVRLICEGE